MARLRPARVHDGAPFRLAGGGAARCWRCRRRHLFLSASSGAMSCSRLPGCWRPRSLSQPPIATRSCARRQVVALALSRSASCCVQTRSSPRRFSPPISCGPMRFSWKRAAIVFVPAAIGFFALVQVVYYGALGATRQHPLQSIMVFDLGGISHFAKQNQYPVTWSPGRDANSSSTAATGRPQWDIYWRLEPCEFVMHRLEARQDFRHAGHHRSVAARRHASPARLSRAPRGIHVEFSSRAKNLTMWTADIDASIEDGVRGSSGFRSRWCRCTTCSSRRRCSAPAHGCSSASRRARSPGGGATRLRAHLRSGIADRPPSIC